MKRKTKFITNTTSTILKIDTQIFITYTQNAMYHMDMNDYIFIVNMIQTYFSIQFPNYGTS